MDFHHKRLPVQKKDSLKSRHLKSSRDYIQISFLLPFGEQVMLPQIICISAKRKEMALESGKVYRIPIKGLQVVEHMQSFYKVFIMPQFLQFSDVYHQQKQNEAVLLR